MKHTATLTTALLLASTLCGCMTTIPRQTPNNWQRKNLEENILFDAEVMARKTARTNKKYSVEQLRIPGVSDKSEVIVIDYYRAAGTHERPLVMVSPILGGERDIDYTIENLFLKYFAEHGMDAALMRKTNIHQVTKADDLFAALEYGLNDIVQSYHRVITVLSKEPNVRKDRLCGFGISFGGIKNVLVAAKDHRLKYNVIALSGSTDTIIANAGPEPLLEQIKEQWWPKYGGKDRFIEELNKQVPTQPQNYAQGLDPERTMFIIARYDNVVPREAAEELRERAGKPTTIYLLGGHYTSVVYATPFPFLEHKICDFFTQKIQEDDVKENLLRKYSVQ